jgi:hypothetical protein
MVIGLLALIEMKIGASNPGANLATPWSMQRPHDIMTTSYMERPE